MSAFITRRGGGGSSPGKSSVITGTHTPTSATSITIPDLIGKSRFVINARISGDANAIMQINYHDGNIRQHHKSGNKMYLNTALVGSSESATFFDPSTGTIDTTAWSEPISFSTTHTYEYVIFK